MVSLGFYDHSRIALLFFQALGLEWDEMADWTEDLHLEVFPQTCTWSIAWWEQLYDIMTDESLSLEVRRQQIMSKALYRAPINPETIRRVVQLITYANEVVVTDFVAPYTFEVSVKHDEPIQNMAQVWEFVYKAKPAHLSFKLYFHLVSDVEHEVHTGLHFGHHRTTNMTEFTKEDWILWKQEEENILSEVNL